MHAACPVAAITMAILCCHKICNPIIIDALWWSILELMVQSP